MLARGVPEAGCAECAKTSIAPGLGPIRRGWLGAGTPGTPFSLTLYMRFICDEWCAVLTSQECPARDHEHRASGRLLWLRGVPGVPVWATSSDRPETWCNRRHGALRAFRSWHTPGVPGCARVCRGVPVSAKWRSGARAEGWDRKQWWHLTQEVILSCWRMLCTRVCATLTIT